MLETVETGQCVAKSAFAQRVPRLRTDLLTCQYEIRNNAPFSVLVVLDGDDWPGRHGVLARVNEWMDARYIQVNAYGQPSDEEAERPFFWRFWRNLPPQGRLGLYFGDWTIRSISDVHRKRLSRSNFERRLAHIAAFERELVENGTLLVKFWLHLPKREFKRRLDRAKKNPEVGWFFRPRDWELFEHYSRFRKLSERALEATHTRYAPWHVVESTDEAYRDLAVGDVLLRRMRHRLEEEPSATSSPGNGHSTATVIPSGDLPAQSDANELAPPLVATTNGERAFHLLGSVDLTKNAPNAEYDEQLPALQARLNKLSRRASDVKMSSVLVFEGWDAAGKGGAIRRLTPGLDATHYRIVATTAPTDEEKARHYLWRFWRQLPRAGHMTIFDRSWYGRVLVERVEGFAADAEWRRAYREINDFEQQLTEHGIVLVKFWLHISPEEQMKRFRDREKAPFKKYKMSAEDYRNRARWPDYMVAAEDMLARTSTEHAPWRLVPGIDKRFARLSVLRTVCESLERALGEK